MKQSNKEWTEEELDILREKYPISTPDQLVELLPDRTKAAIKTKATTLRLYKAVKRFHMTEEQVKELVEMYPRTLNADLATHFGCSLHYIENKSYALRLKKEISFIAEIARERTLDPNHGGRKHWYSKGRVPENKGKKQTDFMSKDGIDRTKATRFKKGSIPHNSKPIGYERVDKDGYIYIKLEGKRKLVLKHRHIWVQHFGPIPKAHNIQFKDGNTHNCDIDNLYMISRKKQMGEENSGSKNLSDGMVALYLSGGRGKNKALAKELKENHPDLIELKRQQLLFNRQIKEQNECNK